MLNWLDIVIGVILIVSFVNGMSKGLVMHLAKSAGIILAVLFAGKLAKYLLPMVMEFFSLSTRTAPAISYLLSFTILLIGVIAIGKSIQSTLEKMHLGGVNKFLGGVISISTALILMSLFLNLIIMLDSNEKIITPHIKQHSVLYKPVKTVVAILVPFLNKEVWQEYVPEKYKKQILEDRQTSSQKTIIHTLIIKKEILTWDC